MSGASNIKANLKQITHKIEVDLSGYSNLNLSGKTDNFDINVESASDINSKNLKGNNVNIENYDMLNLVYDGKPTISKNDNFLSRIEKGN